MEITEEPKISTGVKAMAINLPQDESPRIVWVTYDDEGRLETLKSGSVNTSSYNYITFDKLSGHAKYFLLKADKITPLCEAWEDFE